ILVCIYIGTVGLFSNKSAGFIPTEDAGIFLMGITLPEGASASRTDEFLSYVTKRVQKEIPEVKNITSIAGINILNRSFKSNAGTYFVQMNHWDERQRTVAEILGQIQGMFAGAKEGSVLAVAPPAIPGLGVSGGFSLQIEEQQAGDIKNFQAAVFKFLGAANQRPEIGMAYTL